MPVTPIRSDLSAMAQHAAVRLDGGHGGGDDGGMEARLAKVEATLIHVDSQIGELKTDVRDLRGVVGGLRDSVNGKIDRQLWMLLATFGGGFALLMGAILGLYAK